jgi:hypothetical protein
MEPSIEPTSWPNCGGAHRQKSENGGFVRIALRLGIARNGLTCGISEPSGLAKGVLVFGSRVANVVAILSATDEIVGVNFVRLRKRLYWKRKHGKREKPTSWEGFGKSFEARGVAG